MLWPCRPPALTSPRRPICSPSLPPNCCSLFQLVWGRGEPIIVRGLEGAMGWTPEGLARVCRESGK